MLKIALIGSTGSIGKQVCNVVRRYKDLYRITALVANSSKDALMEQVAEFSPDVAVLINGANMAPMPEFCGTTKLQTGEEHALECIENCDVVFVAAGGFAGLKYSLKAIECGKRLALANKETLVCGGELVMRLVEEKNIDLVPVDSEHSALWQALHFDRKAAYTRLLITASGGPFYGYTREQLEQVTVSSALRHPTWKMGAKITIDSATLLNKGFEVIEARWLYDAPFDKITAVVQPESIIHSMVEFADGGILAQLSYPTMELPIQLALTYPERANCDLKPLDFAALRSINFKPLHKGMFPCFDLALQAGEMGDNYPCILNAAGEVAVNAFLQERIPFVKIPEIIGKTLEKSTRQKYNSYADLLAIDLQARSVAEELLKK